MNEIFPSLPLQLLLTVQGAGSIFIALLLVMLFVYRRRQTFLFWGLSWLCNGAWLILRSISIHLRSADSIAFPMPGVAEAWLQHLGVLMGWEHAALWILSFLTFTPTRVELTRRSAVRGPLFTRQQIVVLLGTAVLAFAASESMGLAARNVLLNLVLAGGFVWGAIVLVRQGRARHRTTALLLAGALVLYALSLVHLAGYYLTIRGTGLVPPYANFTAIANCVIQTLGAVALLLFLLDSEEGDLREAYQRLEASEERFRLIFEHSGVGMSLLSREGVLLAVNPALARMLGYSPEELRSRRLSDFIYANDRSSVGPRCKQDTEAPSLYEREKRYVRKDGQPVWAKVLRVPVRDTSGKTQHYVGVLIDITQRYLAEQKLKSSEERYRLLNQSAKDGIHVADSQGVLMDVNPAFCKMLGMERDDLVGRNLFALAESPEVLREHLSRLLQRGGDRLETRLRCDGGALIDVELSGAVLELEGRRYVHGICRDISERKRTETALRVARDRLHEERDFTRQILETANVLICVLDQEGRTLRFNAACVSLTGYSEQEACGNVFWDQLMPGRHAGDVREAHRSLVASQEIGRNTAGPAFELPWRSRGGEEHLVNWRSSVVRGSRGEVRFVILTGQDVTEQRELESQLRQARKMELLGTLVGGIAHDFNNQLTALLGHLALAEDDLDIITSQSDGVIREACESALENLNVTNLSARRCAEFTQRLLTFASGKVGAMNLIDPSTLLLGAAASLRELIDPSISITIDSGMDVWPVTGDAGQLRQILLNLADNARYAMPDGGELTFSVHNRTLTDRASAINVEARAGDFVELAVADTGTGMTPEVRARLFEPFFTTREPTQAAGMGLAISYGIVKAHKGWIVVHSEPGVGSTFRIYLPRAGTAAHALPGLKGDADVGGRCVLIVDDEAGVRFLAEAVLKRAGLRTLTAEDGEEAVAIYRRDPSMIDLVLLDYSMPKLNGLQVLDQLRALNPSVCVIFSSGYTRDSDSDQLLATGAKAFIPKPYRNDELVTLVRRVLAQNTARSPSSSAFK